MWQFLEDPKTSCLLNVPGADELYGEPVCGNQFVERGEECDCGRPEVQPGSSEVSQTWRGWCVFLPCHCTLQGFLTHLSCAPYVCAEE